MTSSTETNQLKPKIFPTSIAKILSPNRVVINRGSTHGIKEGQRMLVYSLSDED